MLYATKQPTGQGFEGTFHLNTTLPFPKLLTQFKCTAACENTSDGKKTSNNIFNNFRNLKFSFRYKTTKIVKTFSSKKLFTNLMNFQLYKLPILQPPPPFYFCRNIFEHNLKHHQCQHF